MYLAVELWILSSFIKSCKNTLLHMKSLILELLTKVMIILRYSNCSNQPHCAVNTMKSTNSPITRADSLLAACGVDGSLRFEQTRWSNAFFIQKLCCL